MKNTTNINTDIFDKQNIFKIDEVEFVVLESNSISSILEKYVGTKIDSIIRGSLNDSIVIKTLIESCNVTTYKIENINVETLI